MTGGAEQQPTKRGSFCFVHRSMNRVGALLFPSGSCMTACNCRTKNQRTLAPSSLRSTTFTYSLLLERNGSSADRSRLIRRDYVMFTVREVSE